MKAGAANLQLTADLPPDSPQAESMLVLYLLTPVS